MVADKQLLKNAPRAWLPSAFFFPSSSASSDTPCDAHTGWRREGFGTNGPHVCRAFSFFFLPSFLPSLPLSFHPSYGTVAPHRRFRSSLLASEASRTLAELSPESWFTLVTTVALYHVPRTLGTLLPYRDWEFQNRVHCTRIVLINTNLLLKIVERQGQTININFIIL